MTDYSIPIMPDSLNMVSHRISKEQTLLLIKTNLEGQYCH